MAEFETSVTTQVERDRRGDGTAGTTEGILWVYPESFFIACNSETQTLGRSSDCNVVLEGESVSRRHASLVSLGPIDVLKDNKSRNGTYVNGRPVDKVALEEGDVIRLGGWVGIRTSVAEPARPFQEFPAGVIAGGKLASIFELARRVAQSTLPVVVSGETGTGKELLARALHEWAARPGPFVAINCAALPAAIAESELFGHKRGAFSGAVESRLGHFRAADKGTLMLDEIGDLSWDVQSKLLRVLELGEVMPVGESRAVPVDVRVIAAGHGSLSARVEDGTFRADLHARLNGLALHLPNVQSRREEIIPVFQARLRLELGGATPQLDPELVERLCLYRWPHNMRGVVQTARQLAVLHGHEPRLTMSHLPAEIRAPAPVRATAPPKPGARRERAAQARERQVAALINSLRECQGNVSRAAEMLGISRKQAYRLLDSRPELDLAALRVASD